MTTRSKNTKASTRARPLPKSRAVLVSQLRLAAKCANWFDEYSERELLLYEVKKAVLNKPHSEQLLKQLTDTISENQMRQVAKGTPDFDSLLPYMNERRIERLAQQLHRIPLKDHSAGTITKSSIQHELKQARIYAQFAGEFSSLRTKVETKLENMAGSADRKSDKSKKISKTRPTQIPANRDVVALARQINQRIHEEPSKRAIAFQFTCGDRKRADNLLRQLRRFPQLLDS